MTQSLQLQFDSEVPMDVVRTIIADVVPVVQLWATSHRVNLLTDLAASAVQRHANGRDWVWHLHTTDGQTNTFQIAMGSVH